MADDFGRGNCADAPSFGNGLAVGVAEQESSCIKITSTGGVDNFGDGRCVNLVGGGMRFDDSAFFTTCGDCNINLFANMR